MSTNRWPNTSNRTQSANDPELHALWLDSVKQSHQAYVQLTEKLLVKFNDEPDRTLRRKMARQAARSVLPNATETKIFVTANACALRHFSSSCVASRARRWKWRFANWPLPFSKS